MDMLKISIFIGISIIIVTVFVGVTVAQEDNTTKQVAVDTETDDRSVVNELVDTNGTKRVVVRLSDNSSTTVRTAKHHSQIGTIQANAATARSSLEEFASSTTHATVERRLWLANAVVLTVDTDRVPLAELAMINNVDRIHKDFQVSTNATVATERRSPTAVRATTTLSTKSTAKGNSTIAPTRAISEIGVPTVWDTFGTRGGGVKVAVLDSGINPAHPDVNITEDDWACYIDCQDGPHDNSGHGTHVSGTVVGGDNNSLDLQIGVAPAATLMHAKVVDDSGQGNFTTIISGMEWAVENNADVISMSLGTPGYNEELIEPVRNAQANGTTVVAASGNGGIGHTASPGNVYDAIGVGSTNLEPRYPSYGSFGLTNNTVSYFSGNETIMADQFVDRGQPPADWPQRYQVPAVVAPGNLIWSADNDIERVTPCRGFEPTAELACQSGTSMATPHVSGVIALMQSASDKPLSPSEIKKTLNTTTDDIGTSQMRQGNGRINATAAVRAVANKSSNPFSMAIAGENPPANPNPKQDSLYYDVNGDNIVNFDDAVALAFVDSTTLSKTQKGAFDFDEDGDLDFDDAVELAFSDVKYN